MLAGWAYGAIYRDSTERNAALSGWLNWYNTRRPHGALSHKPPIAADGRLLPSPLSSGRLVASRDRLCRPAAWRRAIAMATPRSLGRAGLWSGCPHSGADRWSREWRERGAVVRKPLGTTAPVAAALCPNPRSLLGELDHRAAIRRPCGSFGRPRGSERPPC
jgi:hypothetical protein